MHTLTLNFENITEIQEFIGKFASLNGYTGELNPQIEALKKANADLMEVNEKHRIENGKLLKQCDDLKEENENITKILNAKNEEPDILRIKNEAKLKGRGELLDLVEKSFELDKTKSWQILKPLIIDPKLYTVDQIIEMKRNKIAELKSQNEVK